MNPQTFKNVKGGRQDIFRPGSRQTKRAAFLFLTMITMSLLFSCSKNTTELPDQVKPEANFSLQASAADVAGYEETVPYDRILFIPCGNGGNGEEVALTGSLKFIEQIIYNERGFTFNYHAIPQGITGLGLSSGEQFVASGGDKGIISGEFGEDGQYTRIYMGQFRVIGQNSVFTVLYKSKITITANGEITTSILEDNVDCRL